MLRETIRFSEVSDAVSFDALLVKFLRYCESKTENGNACLFWACATEGGAHIRIIKSDDARMLGRLLNYLSVHNFQLPRSEFARNGKLL